jgi:hypothetical protein
MIKLFPVGLDVLYAVDYTGAIENFNESQFWASTQWINWNIEMQWKALCL